MLLSIEEYQRLTGNIQSIVDLLAMQNAEDIDFDPPKLHSSQFNISIVTILEIEMGVLGKERRDSKQDAMFMAWLENS